MDTQQERNIQLHFSGKACSGRSSFAADSQDVDEILKEMSPRFQKLYSDVGRPSIAPERLLRSLLLQIFYSVRSERMLIEQLQ